MKTRARYPTRHAPSSCNCVNTRKLRMCVLRCAVRGVLAMASTLHVRDMEKQSAACACFSPLSEAQGVSRVSCGLGCSGSGTARAGSTVAPHLVTRSASPSTHPHRGRLHTWSRLPFSLPKPEALVTPPSICALLLCAFTSEAAHATITAAAQVRSGT
jgi:hypothetical protein